MSLQDEVQALREAVVYLLHHGQPKSEAQAVEIAKTLEPREEKTSTSTGRKT